MKNLATQDCSNKIAWRGTRTTEHCRYQTTWRGTHIARCVASLNHQSLPTPPGGKAPTASARTPRVHWSYSYRLAGPLSPPGATNTKTPLFHGYRLVVQHHHQAPHQ